MFFARSKVLRFGFGVPGFRVPFWLQIGTYLCFKGLGFRVSGVGCSTCLSRSGFGARASPKVG